MRTVTLLTAVASFLVILLWPARADAYAWMIRHEYSACTQCHADPSGGSLLTLYGRAQSEVLLRTRYGGGSGEEEPGPVSGFAFGAVKLPDELLLGGDIRLLHLRVKPEGAPLVQRTIWMQADVQGQVTIDRFRANASLGYAHTAALPAAITHGSENNLVSRVHWVGVEVGADRNWLIRAGRMNLPFGLRMPEHTMWVRSATRTNVNDNQQHGIALAYNAEPIRMEIMAIAGNFQVSPSVYRDRGYAGYFEITPIPKFAVGVSSHMVHAEADLLLQRPTFRQAHGLFWRYSPFKSLAILAEGDFLLSSPIRRPIKAGLASMLQLDFEPVQGVHAMVSGETLNTGVGDGPTSFGVWASAAWFFAPHADIRFDAIQQAIGAGADHVGATSLLFQVHAFL